MNCFNTSYYIFIKNELLRIKTRRLWSITIKSLILIIFRIENNCTIAGLRMLFTNIYSLFLKQIEKQISFQITNDIVFCRMYRFSRCVSDVESKLLSSLNLFNSSISYAQFMDNIIYLLFFNYILILYDNKIREILVGLVATFNWGEVSCIFINCLWIPLFNIINSVHIGYIWANRMAALWSIRRRWIEFKILHFLWISNREVFV